MESKICKLMQKDFIYPKQGSHLSKQTVNELKQGKINAIKRRV